jgi:hypothetical protein
MSKAYEVKIFELDERQKSHLAWRLDHKTYCGYITAGHIARGNGEYGRSTLFDIFKSFECSDHSAKIHSKKVINFGINPQTNER